MYTMNILVVGGGMAGLTFAISALRLGYQVTIAEKNNRVGKKISATGNGKCNIGNEFVSIKHFNDSKIASTVLHAINVDTYKHFLHSVGIFTYTDNAGRMYPLSDSASTVVDCLRHTLQDLGGIVIQAEVTQITAKNGKYAVKIGDSNNVYDKVVLSVGSGSQAPAPNTSALIGSQYLTATYPSLVPIKVTNNDPTLNGIRHKCNATLVADGQNLYTESGEVLFRDYGLSGICIFNMSAHIARNLVQGKQHDYQICLDLFPTLTPEELTAILQARTQLPVDRLWGALLHNKLAHYVTKSANCPTDASKLAHTAKNLTFNYSKLLDWTMSQVTAGGVDEQHLNLRNLTLPNGIICIGEMLNVDGLCGGNNLYFAAASALYAVASMD